MAGFFGLFDYNKEGPGVYLNEPPKSASKTFFTILGRKFWKIITINMMYVLLSIPVIIIALLVGTYIFPSLIPFLQLETLEKLLTPQTAAVTAASISQAVSQAVSGTTSQVAEAVKELSPKETAAILFLQFNVVLSMALIGVQLVVCGPVQAGVTYLFRNYSREEHAFIWGDFKDHAKKNFKQSLITSAISFLVFIVLSVNFTFYANNQLVSNVFLNGIFTGLVVILFIMFTIMQMYIYPMMVTFKLTIRQLYKNAFLLTIAKLPSNIGIFLLTLILILAIPMAAILFLGGIGIVVCIFYYLFIGFGINLLLTNFHVYRQLKKYMIDPTLEEERKKKELEGIEEEEKEEPIFQDVNTKDDE